MSSQNPQDTHNWALILGGSSGMGLASARKLAASGYNLFVVHRDRRGAMAAIEEAFAEIREATGQQLVAFNVNALSPEGIDKVLEGMRAHEAAAKVSVVLHSIALGNLKLLAPYPQEQATGVAQLAAKLGIEPAKLQEDVDGLFAQGAADLMALATPPAYDNERLCQDEDFQQTIYNMGTNLVSWVQALFQAGLFAQDARVLGLTSEGNEIAWRGYAAVAAAKSALESVSRAIAREYAAYGIRCNILQPGITDTPALRLIPGSRHMVAGAIQRNPFKRLTQPEDVANVVALMASPEAAWINGALIRVDGGEHISG